MFNVNAHMYSTKLSSFLSCMLNVSIIHTFLLWSSFYPLYPTSEDVPLDFSLATKALHFSSIPDILILPSDLAQFVKVWKPSIFFMYIYCIYNKHHKDQDIRRLHDPTSSKHEPSNLSSKINSLFILLVLS